MDQGGRSMQETSINDIANTRSIRCDVDLQDLLYVELGWMGRGEKRVLGHTVIVLLDPNKILETNLIDEDKKYFFDIDRMNLVIGSIKREGFFAPPIAYHKYTKHFELPNGHHRTILMSRAGIESVPYVTCDHMANELLTAFEAKKITTKFDLSELNYKFISNFC
jgi:hypothetical protein